MNVIMNTGTDAGVDDVESLELEKTETLRKQLEDLATVYNDGERVEVEWSDRASSAVSDKLIRVNPDSSYAGADLTGPERFSLVADTVSHEVGHIKWSDLDSKRKFMDDVDFPAIGGAVINILEDQYIDRRRTSRGEWPGLAPIHAYTVEAIFDDDEFRPPMGAIDSVSKQAVEGLTQLAFAGRVKDFGNADRRVAEFLGRTEPRIERVRNADDPDERAAIARKVYDDLLDVVPDREKAEMYARDQLAKLIRELLDDLDMLDGSGTSGSEADDGPTADADGEDGEDDSDDTGDAGDGEADTDTDPESAPGDGTSDDGDADSVAPTDGATNAEALGDDSVDSWEGSDVADSDEAVKSIAARSEENTPWAGVEAEAVDRAREEMTEKFGRLKAAEREESKYDELREVTEERIRFNRRNGHLYDGTSYEHGHEAIRSHLRESGIAHEIEEVLREFTTADMRVAATDGYDLNMDAIVDYTAGDLTREDLYIDSEDFEVGDRAVALSLDCSGSMEDHMRDAKLAIGAFYLATQEIGDTFLGNGWSDHGGREHTTIATFADPDDGFSWEKLDALRGEGYDPMAAGMAQAVAMLDDVTAREKVLIVLSDGQPHTIANVMGPTGVSTGKRDGSEAVKEVNEYVRHLREEGYVVIGLGVGNGVDRKLMTKMFDDDGWLLADFENLADTLIDIYRGQMAR